MPDHGSPTEAFHAFCTITFTILSRLLRLTYCTTITIAGDIKKWGGKGWSFAYA